MQKVYSKPCNPFISGAPVSKPPNGSILIQLNWMLQQEGGSSILKSHIDGQSTNSHAIRKRNRNVTKTGIGMMQTTLNVVENVM